MRDAQIGLATTHEQINEVFRAFYTKLYTAFAFQKDKAMQFLQQISLPLITDMQLDTLNTPIMSTEVSGIIQKFTNGKAPGPDSYPSEFYKMFKDLLVSTLEQVYLHIWLGEGGYLPTGNESYVRVLPKKEGSFATRVLQADLPDRHRCQNLIFDNCSQIGGYQH